MDGDTLEKAILGARNGDADCLDRLVEHYSGRLYGFLYRMTGSRDDAEDLMQEVFVRLVRMIGAYEHDGRFEAWLFRIAANLVRDRLRRSRRGPRFVATGDAFPGEPGENGDDFGGVELPVDARLIHAEEMDALGAALARLPDVEREVVMLRHFSQMSFREIAEATGVPLGTALARGHRGLNRLRERLTGEAASPKDATTHRRTTAMQHTSDR